MSKSLLYSSYFSSSAWKKRIIYLQRIFFPSTVSCSSSLYSCIYLKYWGRFAFQNHYFYYYCIRNTAIETEKRMRNMRRRIEKVFMPKSFLVLSTDNVRSSRCVAETFFPSIFLRKREDVFNYDCLVISMGFICILLVSLSVDEEVI